jgi:hypothetical protein
MGGPFALVGPVRRSKPQRCPGLRRKTRQMSIPVASLAGCISSIAWIAPAWSGAAPSPMTPRHAHHAPAKGREVIDRATTLHGGHPGPETHFRGRSTPPRPAE